MMPENINDKFFEAMRSIGGLRPAEIDPDVGRVLNADVVFREENAIMEIKTLMADPSEREDYIQKVSAIYHRWVGYPGVPLIYRQRMINTADVPEGMGIELVRTLAGPIRTAVKKANLQIRQIKESLHMSEAHGVLVLCNAGAATLTPHVVLHALYHALGNRYTSITSGIFLTHGVPVQLPGAPEPMEVFCSFTIPERKPLPEAFDAKIRTAWMQFQARTQHIRVFRPECKREGYRRVSCTKRRRRIVNSHVILIDPDHALLRTNGLPPPRGNGGGVDAALIPA